MAITREQLDLLGNFTPETLRDLLQALGIVLAREQVEPTIKVWLGSILLGVGRDVLESTGCVCLLRVTRPAWALPMAHCTQVQPPEREEEAVQ